MVNYFIQMDRRVFNGFWKIQIWCLSLWLKSKEKAREAQTGAKMSKCGFTAVAVNLNGERSKTKHKTNVSCQNIHGNFSNQHNPLLCCSSCSVCFKLEKSLNSFLHEWFELSFHECFDILVFFFSSCCLCERASCRLFFEAPSGIEYLMLNTQISL